MQNMILWRGLMNPKKHIQNINLWIQNMKKIFLGKKCLEKVYFYFYFFFFYLIQNILGPELLKKEENKKKKSPGKFLTKSSSSNTRLVKKEPPAPAPASSLLPRDRTNLPEKVFHFSFFQNFNSFCILK